MTAQLNSPPTGAAGPGLTPQALPAL